MSEEKDMAIAIIRMEKFLASIASKIQESIEKHGIRNSPLTQEMINLIGLFKDSVISRIRKTPEAECIYTINLHDCQMKIKETLLELEALQDTSEEQNSTSEIFLRDLIARVDDKEELMQNIIETSKVEIPREKEASISKMLIVREQKEEQKKLLQSEIYLVEQKLHSIMEFNMTTEKKLLDMRAKVEKEYADILTKYDHDINQSHTLMEKLSRANQLIKVEKKNMEDLLAVQRTLYIQLKRERESELMKAFTEKLELFRRNRAAKIIQRAWRMHFQRISLKKRRKTRRK